MQHRKRWTDAAGVRNRDLIQVGTKLNSLFDWRQPCYKQHHSEFILGIKKYFMF